MSDNSNKKNPLTNAMQGLRASQERLESLTAPMFEQIEHLGRIAKAIANPFGENAIPAKPTPVVIDHETGETRPAQSPSNTGKSKKELKNEIKDLKNENNELKNRLITVMEMAFGLSEKPLTAIEYRPKSSNELQEKNDEIARLKDQLDQKEQKINELQAQIDQLQATATPANDDLIENQDKRTVNNLVRVLLAINEMAKAKQGEYIDFQTRQVKQPLETINKHLALLAYNEIKDTAYNTIRALIREKQQKGL